MIYTIATSKFYWLFLLFFSVSLEAAALIYQYFLDYYPCVLCIHVRIILLGIIIVALIAIKLKSNCKALLSSHFLISALLLFLLERSYNLLGVERGFVTGECSMNSGLPTWFAIDQWFPWMFKIWEPCGYTPELLFGITMAEALLVISIALLILSFAVFLTVLRCKSS